MKIEGFVGGVHGGKVKWRAFASVYSGNAPQGKGTVAIHASENPASPASKVPPSTGGGDRQRASLRGWIVPQNTT